MRLRHFSIKTEKSYTYYIQDYTGILTLTMLGIVLEPLQLPLEAVLVLFVAIDPIINPFRTLGIVHTGIAATAIIADMETGFSQNCTDDSFFSAFSDDSVS